MIGFLAYYSTIIYCNWVLISRVKVTAMGKFAFCGVQWSRKLRGKYFWWHNIVGEKKNVNSYILSYLLTVCSITNTFTIQIQDNKCHSKHSIKYFRVTIKILCFADNLLIFSGLSDFVIIYYICRVSLPTLTKYYSK